MTRNVVTPTITMYQPSKGNANGTALIVAPGGAFYFLMIDKEGADVAKWFTKPGITAFVLKYRVATTPENDSELQPFFTTDELQEIETASSEIMVEGERYPEHLQKLVGR